MASSFSKYYSVGVLCGSSFGVGDGGGKGGMVPRTFHFTSHKVYYCINGGEFFISEWLLLIHEIYIQINFLFFVIY